MPQPDRASTPLHLTRLVMTAANSKKEKARRAPACLLLRVASCLMRGCLQHCVTGNTAHLSRPVASLRVWRWTPNSVATLRTLFSLIRQSGGRVPCLTAFPIAEGCIGPGREASGLRSSGACFLCVIFWFLLPLPSTDVPLFCCHASQHIDPQKKKSAAFCLIFFEFRVKIPEIFFLLCWHRNSRDGDPLISAGPCVAQISAVPVRFCILNQKHLKTSGLDPKHYQFTAASFNCGSHFQ